MVSGELASQLTALVQVVLIDIVLAGDNAVVVGTAAAGLPPTQQRQVIFLGAGLVFALGLFLLRCGLLLAFAFAFSSSMIGGTFQRPSPGPKA